MSAVSIAEKESVLRGCRVFASLPADTIRVFAEMLRVETFSATQLVCEAGEPASELYLVASGELAVTLPGNSRVIRTLRTSDVLGEYGMFGQGVRTSTVTATSDVVLLSVTYIRFRELLLAFPAACLALLEVTVERLTQNESTRPE